jgi:NAD(P)-dependent dehydrogenase (short-subunit alcohol dehydrogenase family)
MDHSSGRLSDRVALITGSTGIAAATARLFCQEGAQVTVVDRVAANLEALAGSLPDLLTITADLVEAGAAQRVVETACEHFGRLDVLVNIAGISGRRFGDGPTHAATDAGWDAVMDTNARTMFSMCRAALAPMLAQSAGVIVNTASVLAYAPNPEFFATHAYAASNGARIALTKAMAAYYAPHGIRVNAVAPGLIATPMSQRAQNDPQIVAYLKTRQPLTGTFGEPDDVAQAILYLSSDAARFVTGVVLEIAGGWGIAG